MLGTIIGVTAATATGILYVASKVLQWKTGLALSLLLFGYLIAFKRWATSDFNVIYLILGGAFIMSLSIFVPMLIKAFSY